MSALLHHNRVSLNICLCAIFLWSALPLVALSQEESSIEAVQENETTSSTTESAVTVEEDQLPVRGSQIPSARDIYKTEQLVGEQVFNDFALGPGKVEISLKPGETRIVEIRVANRYAEEKVFEIDVEDMSGSSDPSQAVVLLGDDVGPYTLKDYISVPADRFTVAANQRALVPVTISIPRDAEPGGRYGSVLVKTVTKPAEEATEDNPVPSSAIVSRIGTLFFVTTPGETESSGALADFSTAQEQVFYEYGPIDFNITYENTGSLHLNPYGELQIVNMFGEEVGYVELEPWFTMPGSVRLREISWNREWLYGKYTATLQLNRGYENIVDEKTITFWVVPWKLILVGFAGLFIFFVLIRTFFRKFEFNIKAK